jgi:hypothetical protein
MRAAMEGYITAHLKLERIANQAATNIESIKVRAAEASKPHENEQALHETVLMRYAEAHPELFEKRQKWEVYGGHRIGWQVGQPAVTLVRPPGEKKKQTWDGFVAACKSLGSWTLNFIRTVEEPDKAEILATHRDHLAIAESSGDAEAFARLENGLAQLGVKVTQEERFVIDLNLTPDAASLKEAA